MDIQEQRHFTAAPASWLLAAVLATGCETVPDNALRTVLGPVTVLGGERMRDEQPPAAEDARRRRSGVRTTPLPKSDADGEDARHSAGFVERGSGRFVKPTRATEAPAPGTRAAQGEITLNFENTSLLEVVKVILSDLLGENYLIDPAVQGSATLQTTRPLSRGALIPTLEMLLRMNGAALVYSDGAYHVTPRDLAIQGLVTPQLGDLSSALPKGFGVRVVPLRYVSALEMQQIIEPFGVTGNIVRVDTARNLLILAGTTGELRGMLDTIDVFDVDWLAGMSVGLFTPDFVDAKTLAQDLRHIFGDQAKGPLAGLVKMEVIDRLNALLVISPRAEYVDKVASWIERLDRDSGTVGQRLFIYHVQNGKAAELADVLNQVFREEGAAQTLPAAEVAPGLEPAEIESESGPGSATGGAEQAQTAPGPSRAPPSEPRRRSTGAEEGLTISRESAVRIIADEVNNALLIMATAQQFRQIHAALKQLDIVPLQVLIEATIAEVTLTGALSLGLEWFFKNHLPSQKTGTATLDLDATAGLAAVAPGFSYAITDSASVVRSVLNTLASDSKLNIVSSPSLMVLNNQKASIQVGDQVPITTQQQQATATASTVVNNIEFRDTGVLLTVTPRVNAGGLVIMEIEQEVSDVAPETIGTLTPTIQQRKINSTVAVQSGETVVLGGLIRENKNRAASGLPLLYQIPVLGLLFGQSSDSTRRTELVVLITPRAVQDASDARAVTNEFRIKMESLKHLQLRGASTPAAGQISGKAEPASRLSTGGAPSLRFPTRLSRPVASTGGSREGQAASLRPVVARPYRRTIRDAPLELKFDANFSRRRAEAGAEAEVEATTGETHWLGAMFSRLFRRP